MYQYNVTFKYQFIGVMNVNQGHTLIKLTQGSHYMDTTLVKVTWLVIGRLKMRYWSKIYLPLFQT